MDFIYVKELRLLCWTSEKFNDFFRFFAEIDDMEKEQMNQYFVEFQNGIIIEIGGNYGGESLFFIMNGNKVFIVECGYWD